MPCEFKPYTVFVDQSTPSEMRLEAKGYDEGLMPYWRKVIALGRIEYKKLASEEKSVIINTREVKKREI